MLWYCSTCHMVYYYSVQEAGEVPVIPRCHRCFDMYFAAVGDGRHSDLEPVTSLTVSHLPLPTE